jgi:hypothetical protein
LSIAREGYSYKTTKFGCGFPTLKVNMKPSAKSGLFPVRSFNFSLSSICTPCSASSRSILRQLTLVTYIPQFACFVKLLVEWTTQEEPLYSELRSVLPSTTITPTTISYILRAYREKHCPSESTIELVRDLTGLYK